MMSIIFCLLKYLFFLSAVSVILNVQTIYTVFSLILAFIFAAFLSPLGGANFIGFILIVVYVGAVLVFFLSVVMILDMRTNLQFNLYLFHYLFIIAFFCLGGELALITYPVSGVVANEITFVNFNFNRVLNVQSNIVVIGYLLYTWYVFPLIICSLIPLVAMIGAIVLLTDRSQNVELANKKALEVNIQNISDQVSVQEFEVLKLVGKVKINYLLKKKCLIINKIIWVHIFLSLPLIL